MATKEKDKKGLIVLALLGLLLLMLGGKKPPGGGGAATPGGNIGSVDVSQGYAQGGYAARAHLIPKPIGSTVTITLTWAAATKDFQGQPIPWNYGISWRYIKKSTGTILIGGFFNIGSRPNGSFGFDASDLVDALFTPGNWSVQVRLVADTSSPTGTPNNDMPALEDNALLIATGEHNNAFQVV